MTDNTTPIGGDRSDVQMFDAAGNRTTDPAQAVAAEITEYAGGVAVRRTYMERGAPPSTATASTPADLPAWTPPGDAVDEPDAYDMTKATWDVMNMRDGVVSLVETLPDLLESLDVADAPEDEQRAAVAAILPLASWQAAPAGLRAQVDEWMGGGAAG